MLKHYKIVKKKCDSCGKMKYKTTIFKDLFLCNDCLREGKTLGRTKILRVRDEMKGGKRNNEFNKFKINKK